ncbi:Oleandomycin glycosyltransferase [Actinokineospora sp. UTMC 2448]|nr:Oleandomycin glycosyltransferase [Actinokineospora sp. UTMC 2448]
MSHGRELINIPTVDVVHVLFSSLSAYGHTYPLLPLARAMAARGDRVTFATGPEFTALLTKLGFGTAEVGLDIGAAFGQAVAEEGAEVDFRNPEDPAAARAIGRVFGSLMPRKFAEDLGPVLDRDTPDLVVYEVANPGAAIAAKARGIRAVGHGISRGDFGELLPELPGLLSAVAADFGVDLSTDALLEDDLYLDTYPASLQDSLRSNRQPLRPVAFAEPGDLPAWVTAHEKPLVYLTLGTAFGKLEVLRTAIDGLARLPVNVLVAAGPAVDAEELRDLPAAVTVLPWVPQADLLPHTDLVVHHGGSGTTLGALAAGLPQLFLPQGADQFVNADAVTAAGISRTLKGDAATADAVAEAAGALLSDSEARAAVARVAAEIAAMPGPDEVAESLAR